jgi:hypothetical protein
VLQRLIAALLGVLGASATAWRADDPLVATVTAAGDGRTLVTDPGVLELAGDPVTVTVRAGEDPVVLAIGRDTDVDAWIGTDPYTRVTGLSDWHTLATVTGEPPAGAEPTADPSAAPTEAAADPSATPTEGADQTAVQTADPTGSDLWVVETAGDGTTSLRWDAQPGRWSLIAVSLGDTAPTLDLSWPQTVTTPWLWPGVAVGVLLVAVSAILWIRIWRRSRLGPDADWHDVSTGMIAAVARPDAASAGPAAPVARTVGTVDLPSAATGAPTAPASGRPATAEVPIGSVATPTPGQPLTRRQLREAEAAAAAEAKRRGGRRPATGAVPVVPGPPTGQLPAVPTTPGDRPGSVPAGGAASSTTVAAPGSTGTPTGAPSPTARPTTPAAPITGSPTTPGVPSTAAPSTGARAGSDPARGVPTSAPAAPGASTPGTRPGTPTAPATATGRPAVPGTAVPGTAASALAPSAPGAAHAPSTAPVPGTAPAPATAPAPGTADAEPAAPARRRGLGALLGRRGRGDDAPTPTPAPPVAEQPAPAPAPRAATSWTPIPGQPARPATTGSAPAGPTGPVLPGSATPAAGAPGDEDGAARAQRADAWRRMWGFSPEGSDPTDDAPQTDRPTDRPTQEDR